MTATHGNFIDKHKLEKITPGTHTRADVVRMIGSPTTTAPFDAEKWYYIAQQTEKYGVFEKDVTAEQTIVIAFDENGVVRSVTDRSGARVNVPYAGQETPTHGNNVNPLQQFLGNIGKFNPQQPE